ncbi:MAG: 30S ribosomal protein S8 [Opitutales bacterium]|nr:30S ribosomal protein S8 [Opitutales bacterium]
MSAHDTIGDFLTILRNGARAGKENLETTHSNTREGILKILKSLGYINGFGVTTADNGLKRLSIEMKFVDGVPSLTDIQRVSKPGRRAYTKATEIPKVLGGIGYSILTTPKGVLSDRDARKENVGGEIICKVW